jgi:hypothetical protein
MDGKVKKYIVNWKTYNLSDLWGIREKQAPEVVAQANKVSKAISDLKAIENWKGNIMWSSLRSVLDDLWIKDVNSIPEWTEEDILQMVRARKPVAPKKWMPKLWKETLEQNITTPYKNNYIAQYGASSNDINIDARKWILSDKVLWLSNQLKELPNFEWKTIRTSNSIFGKAIDKVNVWDILTDKWFLSSSKTKSKVRWWYGDYEIVIDWISGKDITKIKWKVYDKLEPEILFDRNTPFIVKKKIWNKVYIEEQANKKSLPPLPKKWK